MSSPEEILAAHYAANPHVAAQLQTPDKSPAPSVDSAGVVDGCSLHTDGRAVHVYEPAEVGLSSTALARLTTYMQSVVNDVRVPHGSESLHSARCAAKTDATRSFVNCVLSPFTACRSDVGLAPRQDCLLRGYGSPERRHRGVVD